MALDSKANPQEALNAFKQLTDQGVRFFFQGNSSAVAGALSDADAKHNSRNPDSTILFLNYGAVDPALTNDRCNFWHFRFDADADMKMQALTNYMATQKNIKKVYLINQDYAFGQAVSKARAGDAHQEAARHRDRRRRSASAGQGQGLRALRRQDQGLRRRHAWSPATGARTSRC